MTQLEIWKSSWFEYSEGRAYNETDNKGKDLSI